MKTRNVYLIIICAAIFLFMFAANKTLSQGRIDDTNVISEMKRGDKYVLNISSDEIDSLAGGFGKLYKEADCVLVVTPTLHRINSANAIFTFADIDKAIKDCKYINKKQVLVCEPCNFNNRKSYISTNGYNIMQQDKKYVLFLKKVKSVNSQDFRGYTVFTPVSPVFGKFCAESEDVTADTIKNVDLNNSKIMYSDIADWDILTSDMDVLEEYKDIKKLVYMNLLDT